MHRKTITRTLRILLGAALGLNVMTGAAFAEPSSDPATGTNPSQAKYECSDSHHSDTGHGANNSDGYQSTCDETDFGGNGQESGPGNQTGKPCAGCVGNADDKNPPGQFPDGSDHNSGYECDGRDRPSHNQEGNGNHGIGDENPAHTGCTPAPTPAPVCPDGSAMPTSDLDGSGVIDTADCTWTPPPPATCPDGSALPMEDIDGNGHINAADCNKVDDEDELDPVATCPGTDIPMTDTTDCTPDETDEVPTPTLTPETIVPEVTTSQVVPVVEAVVTAAPAAPAVAVLAALDVPAEQVAAAPVAPARPTQVLGVQVERADLARTGLPANVLVLLAGALLVVGLLLVRTGRPSVSR